MKLLIVDGYPESARNDLKCAGASQGWQLFERMVKQRASEADVAIIYPADEESLPEAHKLKEYHGILWTGCNLCLHDDTDKRVHRQVELARRAFQAGVPQFGSCWAIQIAAVAAGGKVAANPRGREMGIARKIGLTDEGKRHPMYEGKSAVFDAFICHLDEVTELPESATLLACNSFTHVQGLEVRHLNGTFWGVQYHPEYNVKEMAMLANARKPALIKEGFFLDDEAASAYVARLEALYAEPQRKDLSWGMSIDEDVLDDDIRQRELINWLRYISN